MFNINGQWRQGSPTLAKASEPVTLHPMKTLPWKYEDVEGLMNDGIYSPQDLNRLHDHLNFPLERAALLDHVARRLSDKPTPEGVVKLRNLLDEESVTKLAESTFLKIWNSFTKFRIYSAGVIAILMIIQLFKAIIDTIIHGYTLYKIYGWSVRLLGAIWSSITNLLVHLANTSKTEKNCELKSIIKTSPTTTPRPATSSRGKEISSTASTHLASALELDTPPPTHQLHIGKGPAQRLAQATAHLEQLRVDLHKVRTKEGN